VTVGANEMIKFDAADAAEMCIAVILMAVRAEHLTSPIDI
jgi:hypothetical protein